MISRKPDTRDPTGCARAPDVPIEHVVEVAGERYLMPVMAVEMLAHDTGLMSTQAAHRLRRLAQAGEIGSHRLNARLAVYRERDVINARARILEPAAHG